MEYIAVDVHRRWPGILDVVKDGEPYRFRLLHASRQETRPAPLRRIMPTAHDHGHDVFHVVLYRGGQNRFAWQGNLVAARRGTLVLSDFDSRHDFGAHDPKGKDASALTYAEVTFQLEGDAGLLREAFACLLSRYTGLELTKRPMPMQLDEAVTARMLWVFDVLLEYLLQDSELGRFHACRSLLDLFGIVAESWRIGSESVSESKPERPATPVPSPLARTRIWLEQHFREEVMLADAAEAAHVSESHLCRAFRKAYGQSPMQYLLALRVRAAQTLLVTTTLQCKEIAARTGFTDEYHFSRMFRRVAGVSPRQYRRQA